VRQYEITIAEMQKEIHALQLRVKELVEERDQTKKVNKMLSEELALHLDKQIKQNNFEKDCI
jgi:stress-induced morphogen